MKNGRCRSSYINMGSFILFLILLSFFAPESLGRYFRFSILIMIASFLMGAVFIAIDRNCKKKLKWKESMASIEWISIFLGFVSIFFRFRGDFYYLEYLLPMVLGIKFGEIFSLKIFEEKNRRS